MKSRRDGLLLLEEQTEIDQIFNSFEKKKEDIWKYPEHNTSDILRHSLTRLIYLHCFYACLAAFFIAYMYPLFYFTIQRDKPHHTGLSSSLQLNPGIAVVPTPSVFTSLVHFRVSDPVSYSSMVDEMSAFLSYYNVFISGGMFRTCHQSKSEKVLYRRQCKFDTNAMGPCNLRSGYGYFRGQPCFAVKLNRIFGWLPDVPHNVSGVQIKCEGYKKRDADFLGQVCYYDMQALREKSGKNAYDQENLCDRDYGLLDSVFYPYLSQTNYQPPLVFVQFRNPKRHVVIWVKCYAIAKNIYVNPNKNEGSNVFQILVD